MRNFFFLLSGTLLSVGALATPSSNIEEITQREYRESEQLLLRFVAVIQAGEKEKAANMIYYPIPREEPLPPIKGKREFLAHYDQFFDNKMVKAIVTGKKDVMNSWRGTSIAGGILYASAGKVSVDNARTETQIAAAGKARLAAQAETHPSVADYGGIAFSCRTKSHFVQIQSLKGKGLRYVAWAAKAGLTEKPELVLDKGEFRADGTGGTVIYQFRNGDYLYEVQATGVCGQDCSSYLTISKAGKEFSRRPCREK